MMDSANGNHYYYAKARHYNHHYNDFVKNYFQSWNESCGLSVTFLMIFHLGWYQNEIEFQDYYYLWEVRLRSAKQQEAVLQG